MARASKAAFPFDDERLIALYERVRKPVSILSPAKERRLWVRPKIPGVMLQRAVHAFAPDASQGRALVLCDATRMRTVRSGFLLTSAAFYCRAMASEPKSFRHADLVSAEIDGKGDDAVLKVVTTDDTLTFSPVEVDLGAMKLMVAALIEARELGLTEDTARFVIIEHMPDPVRLAYVRAVVGLGSEEGVARDPRELAAIELLMTRLQFDDELRGEIRELAGTEEELDSACALLDKKAPRGTERGLWLSLFKDALCLARVTRPKAQLDDLTEGLAIAARFQVTSAQAECLASASHLEELLLGGVEEDDLAAAVEDLTTAARTASAPLPAAYLSGSSVGLSAPTIALALARLGVEGHLGTGSLATGDHAFVTAEHGPPTTSATDLVTERSRMLAEVLATHHATVRGLGAGLSWQTASLVGLGVEQLAAATAQLTRCGGALEILLDRWETLAEDAFARLEEAEVAQLSVEPPAEEVAAAPVTEVESFGESVAVNEEAPDAADSVDAEANAEPAPKRRRARKAVAKKAAAKPPAANEAGTNKAATNKAAAKKTAAEPTVAKRTVAKKTAAKTRRAKASKKAK